jgi:UDP-N-acetylglucosamine--N-acetylmuramyl-(pentapeptide) pyrophosphoryl-undecaprenol N-acetylglucosamine transferase
MNNDPTPDRLQRSDPPLSGEGKKTTVLVAAGGTGGHLFPAQALAAALNVRGIAVALATDVRAARYGDAFSPDAVHVIPSATFRGRDPISLARTVATLGFGVARAWSMLGRVTPSAVVGFGGYPSVPPVLAASLRGIPTILHEQNGVMGRANRFLSGRVTSIATGFPDVLKNSAFAAKTTYVGNPIRPAVVAVAATPYAALESGGTLRLLVFGGSQGARVFSDVMPAAIEQLDPGLRARLYVVQQAREEDLARVRETYGARGVRADVRSFFDDLPARMAASHLVISRSGASTVAELSAIGRPAILVPLPHALDQDQAANAGALEKAGGAIPIRQEGFTPGRVAAEITAFAADPARLSAMAQGARSIGRLDAAEKLADLVVQTAYA